MLLAVRRRPIHLYTGRKSLLARGSYELIAVFKLYTRSCSQLLLVPETLLAVVIN